MNALMAYGASNMLFDRTLNSSDPMDSFICTKCNNQTIYVENKDLTFCLHCEEVNTAAKVLGSATFHQVFTNQLLATGIVVKVHVTK